MICGQYEPPASNVADIDADLAAWLRHYNFERPHRGYRTAVRLSAQTQTRHDFDDRAPLLAPDEPAFKDALAKP